MAGKFGKKARKLPIEELAIKHLLVHRNDKSGGIRARMNRTFGRRATQKAIEDAYSTIKMCDPGFQLTKREYERIIGF